MGAQSLPSLLFIGNMSFDHISNIRGITQTVIGGSAYNAAFCARLVCGLGIRICSAVGEDFPLSLVEEQQIDTSGIHIVGSPSNSFLINEATGEIRFEGDPLMIPRLKCQQTTHLHLSCRKGVPFPFECLEGADFTSSSIDVLYSSLEENFKQIKKCLERVDILFVNKEEYDTLSKLLKGSVERAFPRLLIIETQGREGIHVKKNLKHVHLQALEAPGTLVSCVGAGDALAGSFLGAFYSSRSIEVSFAKAVSVASVSLLDFGVSHVKQKLELVEQCYNELISDYFESAHELHELFHPE